MLEKCFQAIFNQQQTSGTSQILFIFTVYICTCTCAKLQEIKIITSIQIKLLCCSTWTDMVLSITSKRM